VPPTKWFASCASDAIALGRFTEASVLVVRIACENMADAQREFRRRVKTYQADATPNVTWNVRRIEEDEYLAELDAIDWLEANLA
jgi:hypothetical protein